AFEITLRYQLNEVLVSLIVFAEDNQVIRPSACGITIMPAGFSDIHFATDDRFDAGFLCGFIKADRAEEVAMIRYGNCGHFVFCCGLCKSVVIAGAIEKTETGVKVEMNECRHVYSHSIVAGGFEVMSYTTRLIPFTSFTMRLEMTPINS